jgi:site-specific recombinase XerD
LKNISYHQQVNINNIVKLRELIKALPYFTNEFFIGIEPTTSSRTRIAYAYDLGIFFDYVITNIPLFENKLISAITVSDLDLIAPTDIEMFQRHLNYYNKDNKDHTNDEKAKSRKIACLRTFYNYFYKKQKIKTNPPQLVDLPKQHEKNIIRLDPDEVAKLLDAVESGENLTKGQLKYHKKTKIRDLALLTLLLGTGIRVSECVGLDILDVDFENNGIKILRKGGDESIVYFGDEVRDGLLEYLEQRNKIIPLSGHEDALFLSMKGSRLSVRQIQELVKKYAKTVTALKHITPHKLRSTYGTSLYRETGDIYLVADVLGHSDVNTTRKHYAQLEDSRRRSAAKAVSLRKS